MALNAAGRAANVTALAANLEAVGQVAVEVVARHVAGAIAADASALVA